MNRINISILVSTLLGISLVDVMPLCLFPGETVLEVQPDGSTTCVCDTLNHYCGPRDDMCYLVKCEGNKILLQSCSCVCPPNYTENTNGECIPDQPSSEPLRCKSGEVVLLNGQCGLPSTTTRVTTTTASPTETNRKDAEIRLSDLTPNTTNKIETKYDLTDGIEILTVSDSMHPSLYIVVTICVTVVVCFAILFGLYILINNNNRRQGASVGNPDHTSTDKDVHTCLDTNAEGTGTSPKDTNPTETEDNNETFNGIGGQENQGPLYPAPKKTDNRVTDAEQTGGLYRPTFNGSVQRAGTGRDVIDPEDTQPLLSWKESSSIGVAHDSDGNSQEMDTLSKSLFSVSEYSDSAPDETNVKTEHSPDPSIPDDNTYSKSFPCLEQPNTDYKYVENSTVSYQTTAQPNTNEANHRLLVHNQNGSQSMPRTPMQVQQEDVNQRQNQTNGICMENLPSNNNIPIINSLRSAGNTQPISSSYVSYS